MPADIASKPFTPNARLMVIHPSLLDFKHLIKHLVYLEPLLAEVPFAYIPHYRLRKPPKEFSSSDEENTLC